MTQNWHLIVYQRFIKYWCIKNARFWPSDALFPQVGPKLLNVYMTKTCDFLGCWLIIWLFASWKNQLQLNKTAWIVMTMMMAIIGQWGRRFTGRNDYCGGVVPRFTSGQEWEPWDNQDYDEVNHDHHNETGKGESMGAIWENFLNSHVFFYCNPTVSFVSPLMLLKTEKIEHCFREGTPKYVSFWLWTIAGPTHPPPNDLGLSRKLTGFSPKSWKKQYAV